MVGTYSQNQKIFATFTFISLILTYLFIIIIKNNYNDHNIIIKILKLTFLAFETYGFCFWPNLFFPSPLIMDNPFDEFCVNEYSYRNCMNDKEIRKIIIISIVILLFLSPSLIDFANPTKISDKLLPRRSIFFNILKKTLQRR